MNEERKTTDPQMLLGEIRGLEDGELATELEAAELNRELLVAVTMHYQGETSVVSTRVPALVAGAMLRLPQSLGSVTAPIVGFAFQRLLGALGICLDGEEN